MKQKTICLIKGNPKYWINISDKFYKDIKLVVQSCGFNFVTSESEQFVQAPDADMYILFSRGCGRARFIQDPIAYIGCGNSERNGHPNAKNIWLVSDGDNTSSGDTTQRSMIAHWTLTNINKRLLRQWLLK